MGETTHATLSSQLHEISEEFASQRSERQQRRSLDIADFDRLRDAGFALTGVPAEKGGHWESAAASTRPTAEALRCLARGDSSVALVAAMHPAVLAFWLASPQVDAEHQAAWDAQRAEIFDGVIAGDWWGTVTSEPGSGGDMSKSSARAQRQSDGRYRLSGQKHFGSGAGMSRYMITSAALADADTDDAELFYLETRGHAWDGSDGMKLIAEWDGHGMAATQSHAFQFDGMPAVRFAWEGQLQRATPAAFGFVGCIFAAVVVGICDVAVETAGKQLAPKADTMRAFDRVEWARAEIEHWLILQAYEGMLRAVESAPPGGTPRGVVQGKMAIAELAESAMSRICKVVGGGTFHRRSPLGHWYEDVRALGFLRPPWGLAYDRLLDSAFPNP